MSLAERVEKARRLIEQGRVRPASADPYGFLFVSQGASGRYLTAALPATRAELLRAPAWSCTCRWGREHSGEPDNECAHALAARYQVERMNDD